MFVDDVTVCIPRHLAHGQYINIVAALAKYLNLLPQGGEGASHLKHCVETARRDMAVQVCTTDTAPVKSDILWGQTRFQLTECPHAAANECLESLWQIQRKRWVRSVGKQQALPALGPN